MGDVGAEEQEFVSEVLENAATYDQRDMGEVSGRCAHATAPESCSAFVAASAGSVHCSRPIKCCTSGCAARIAFRRATCHCAGVACASEAAAEERVAIAMGKNWKPRNKKRTNQGELTR